MPGMPQVMPETWLRGCFSPTFPVTKQPLVSNYESIPVSDTFFARLASLSCSAVPRWPPAVRGIGGHLQCESAPKVPSLGRSGSLLVSFSYCSGCWPRGSSTNTALAKRASLPGSQLLRRHLLAKGKSFAPGGRRGSALCMPVPSLGASSQEKDSTVTVFGKALPSRFYQHWTRSGNVEWL